MTKLMTAVRNVVLALVAAAGLALAFAAPAAADDCPGLGRIKYNNSSPYGQERAREICWEYISQHYAILPDEGEWRKTACLGSGKCTATPHHWNRCGAWHAGESPVSCGRAAAPAPRAPAPAKAPAKPKVVAPAPTSPTCSPVAVTRRASRDAMREVKF